MTQWDILEALGDIAPRHLKSLNLLYSKEPMWRYVMKKSVKFAVTAAAVVITLGIIAFAVVLQTSPQSFGGPAASQPSASAPPEESEPVTLRVCVDLDKGFVQHPFSTETAVNGFLKTVADMGGPDDFTVEIVPGSGAERETALTKLRTQVMAGEGPDVFIVIGGNDNPNFSNDDNLFSFPEKTMENGVFLRLDEYIDNARFMEWDKLTPAVMEAGKTEKGQMLLPLCYTFPITVFNAEDVPSLPTATTWDEMVDDKTGLLAASANIGSYDAMGHSIMTRWYLFPSCVFGRTEDYAGNKLAFSESDLLHCMEQACDLEKREQAGKFSDLPVHYSTHMAVKFDSMDADEELYQGIDHDSSMTFVPCYRKDGGVTATVTAFAGINANTRRPEDAFFVLDALLSQETQRTSSLYKLYFGEYHGVPTYEGLMTKELPASGGWYMSEDNYQAFSKVREQITAVRFSTRIDMELAFLAEDCRDAGDKEQVAELVSKAYKGLQMEVAES